MRGPEPESSTFCYVKLTETLVASWSKQGTSLNGSSGLPARRTAKSWVVGKPEVIRAPQGVHDKTVSL